MEEDWNISGSEDEGDVHVGGRNAARDNQGKFSVVSYLMLLPTYGVC